MSDLQVILAAYFVNLFGLIFLCAIMIDTSLSQWREHVGQQLLKLDFKPLGTDPFHASLQAVLMHDGVKIAHHRSSAGFTFRDSRLVKDSDYAQALVFPRTGWLEFSHHGQSGRVAKGEATLLSTFETGELGGKSPDYFAIIVPGELKQGPSLVARRWPHENGCLRLLQNYVALLAREEVSSAEASAAAARHVLDLLDHAALEQSTMRSADDETAAGSISNVRLRLALDFIGQQFRDEQLNIAAVATSQGISTRYLQRLFEQNGIRFTTYVNELRLDDVLAAFAGPAGAVRNITDIALASGFSDISNFNRQFRHRYGVTPSALRQHLCGRNHCADRIDHNRKH